MRVSRGQLTNGRSVRTQLPHLRIDQNNLYQLTEQWHCDASVLLQRIPQIDQAHSEFPQLVCKEVRPVFLQAGLGRWTATYKGLVRNFAGGQSLPPDQISIESVASQEDIRSHPDFAALKSLAEANDGYTGDPENEDILLGFTAPSELAGVQTFFAPSVVFTRVRYTTSVPSGGATVGKINNPSNNLANQQTTGSQNWLKLSFVTERFGDIWQTRESWLRSGDKGWSTAIYS